MPQFKNPHRSTLFRLTTIAACGIGSLAIGMWGLQLAPITGQLVADLISGQAPTHDLAPFAPDRFRLGAHHEQDAGVLSAGVP